MISLTEEAIEKINSELTDEQIMQLVYLLQKDKLVELKELARKKCKTKFIMVMRKYINKFFKDLDKLIECSLKNDKNINDKVAKVVKNYKVDKGNGSNEKK